MRSGLTFLLLLALVLCGVNSSFAQLYTFDNFNHRDGLNMAVINSVNQSDDGYIWVGTDGAELVRFDGENFEEIRIPNTDNNHHISDISFYESDVLFASLYKGFFQYSPTSDTLEKLNNDEIKHGEALAVFRQKSRYYFFGTRAIFQKVDGKCNTLFKLDSGQKAIEITQLVQTEDAIFILSNYGKYRLSEGKLTPIHKWLNISKNKLDGIEFGYYDGEKLALFNNKGTNWLEVVLNDRGGFYSINPFQNTSVMQTDEFVISCSFNEKARKGGLLSNKGTVYSFENKELNRIAHNYNKSMEESAEIFTDIYGDYWITSNMKGLYKVSKEPFTKLELHPLYESSDIALPYRTSDGNVIISLYSNETYFGKMFNGESFTKYDFMVKGIAQIGSTHYLATNTGIRTYGGAQPNFDILYFKNQNITSVLADGKYLWAGIAGKGLHRVNTETGKITEFLKSDIPLPEYYYTGQVGDKGKVLYFGTNNGIYQYKRNEKKITRVDLWNNKLGTYSGVSTKDKFGTCWFTLEKGLVGITIHGAVKIIKGEEYFETTLFYTLNSDKYGNLIVGTNKGITMLKVDAEGKVINKRVYDDQSGFMGYETNMRSQYQKENSIFVGTVEGLFLINTDMLENQQTPLAPIILKTTDDSHSTLTGSFNFDVHVNNPKAGNIRFAYRLKGEDEHWKLLEEKEKHIDFHDLESGDYVLEVKASYDGVHFGEISSYPFAVNLPIWKTNWFILVLMIGVVLINIFLINYYKSFDSGKLMNTKDIVVHLRMTPSILFFAAVTAPTSQILGPILSDELDFKLAAPLAMGFILLTLYFLSLTSKSNNRQDMFDIYLKLGLFVVMANFMWEVYASKLHPFNIIGVVLISTIAPYIVSKIKSTIIFALILLSISVCFVSILDDTVYPKTYFLIGMFVMSSLMIFSSYLRYDSLEKLIFVSSIINKGNIPAIAFNKEGKVTYSSENIANFANITHDEFIGNNISILNNFIPFGDQFKETDITKGFQDGQKYLVPLENMDGDIRWIEWDYKDFSRNIKVILGQDVSEKMELENTYELLVQNAQDFIYRCDINGNFIFLNDVCYTKLGYSKDDLIGTFSLDIIPEEYHDNVEKYYQNHFAEKLTSSYREFPIKKKNGDIVWIGQYVTTLYSAGSNSHINGFIALARDITEIREQQEIIKDQRDAITSSISYARRIQYNLLPREERFETSFDEHFIISKPKDIVSGDFYWMQKVQKHTVLVLADCTGHGVPGSFMTLLGFNLLNSTVLENGIVDPAMILNDLDKKLKEYLPKGEGDTAVNDGMEVTICVFEEDSDELAYACAGSRFLIFEKTVFTMFKGDNKHIGDIEETFEGYNTHYANFSSDYNLFLFTDGFQDQFGGPKDKKYSFRRLLELFESNINLPLSEQRNMIEDSFDKWTGDNQQTDDVTVISIKKKIK